MIANFAGVEEDPTQDIYPCPCHMHTLASGGQSPLEPRFTPPGQDTFASLEVLAISARPSSPSPTNIPMIVRSESDLSFFFFICGSLPPEKADFFAGIVWVSRVISCGFVFLLCYFVPILWGFERFWVILGRFRTNSWLCCCDVV